MVRAHIAAQPWCSTSLAASANREGRGDSGVGGCSSVDSIAVRRSAVRQRCASHKICRDTVCHRGQESPRVSPAQHRTHHQYQERDEQQCRQSRRDPGVCGRKSTAAGHRANARGCDCCASRWNRTSFVPLSPRLKFSCAAKTASHLAYYDVRSTSERTNCRSNTRKQQPAVRSCLFTFQSWYIHRCCISRMMLQKLRRVRLVRCPMPQRRIGLWTVD